MKVLLQKPNKPLQGLGEIKDRRGLDERKELGLDERKELGFNERKELGFNERKE